MIKISPPMALVLWATVILACATSRFRPAKVASDRPLDYPLAAQLDRIEGEVVVGVFVNADGHPERVNIIKSSGHTVLDTAAFKFAQTLTFQPARVDEKPIASWTKLLLRYKLTDVVFERSKWTRDVLYLQKLIRNAAGQEKKAEYQRKLYIRYVGLVDYVSKYYDLDINYTIKSVIQESTIARWRDFWPQVVVLFALFDDFMYQYPDSELNEQVKEDLIRLLIEAEGDIRVKALRSRKLSQKAAALISIIESRLNELQAVAPGV